MKILVCGGRDFNDYTKLKTNLDKIIPEGKHVIIDGAAWGADYLAFGYAQKHGHISERYPAKWHKYGKRAGYLRNQQMLDEGKPDLVVAFPGGVGTQMMIGLATKAGVKVIKVK